MRLGIFISGGGTTMLEVILACKDGPLSGLVEPAVVIASKSGIRGIERAREAGIAEDDIIVCPKSNFSDELRWGRAILSYLHSRKVEVIGQLGWMPMTPVNIIAEYEGMMWNQHPAPLDTGHPDFGGVGMHGRRAHCARLFFARSTKLEEDQFTEATAHRVTGEFDKGEVIGRIRVPILHSDDVVSLAERVLPFEHELQISIAKQFAEETVSVQPRVERLIKPSQERLLEESKRVAGLLFPKG